MKSCGKRDKLRKVSGSSMTRKGCWEGEGIQVLWESRHFVAIVSKIRVEESIDVRIDQRLLELIRLERFRGQRL